MPLSQRHITTAAGTAILLLTLLACDAAPSQSVTSGNANAAPASQPAAIPGANDASTSSYDYYILNLSWSPEFCFSHRDNPQCASHPGFVVHGLWPERNDGTYPENCPSRPGSSNDADWQGVIPTAYLAQHEWETHGACTPYSPGDFFKLTRRAYQSIKIPDALTHTTQQTMQPPDEIIQAFARVNTGLPAGSIVLSCGNNYLTAIEVCFDKNLNPRACTGLRTCRANAVKITPQVDSR